MIQTTAAYKQAKQRRPMQRIGEFHNVFKWYAYSVNKRFLTTAKLVRSLWHSDVATTNVCKVGTIKRNHIERSRWTKWKWLITGLRLKKYPLMWIKSLRKSPLTRSSQMRKVADSEGVLSDVWGRIIRGGKLSITIILESQWQSLFKLVLYLWKSVPDHVIMNGAAPSS